MKDLSVDEPTTAKVANRLPPPVVIRRKQIPPLIEGGKQRRDSNVADSSVSDEGTRPSHEVPNERFVRGRKRKVRGHSRRGYEGEEYTRGTFEFLLENDGDRADRSRGKWGSLPKSASTNGTARVFAEAVGGGGTTASITSSSSYERDLQSLFCVRPCVNSNFISEAGTSAGGAGERRFATGSGIRISGSTSSDLQEESELSSEERDALIEDVARTPSSVCRNRIPKFGARRRVVAASGSSAAKDYYPRTAGDRLLDLNEDPCCISAAAAATTVAASASGSLARQQNVHVINETVHVINETDTYPDDLPRTSQKPTSAPTTLSLGRKLTSWTKEGKDLLVKSVSSANTLAPTTMTCIKSPRAMSEHLLGLDGQVPIGFSAFRVKGGSLKEGERSEKMTDIPRQRWSSVRVKGGSTKSLLLENGGPQQPTLKGGLTKEVFRTNVSRVN